MAEEPIESSSSAAGCLLAGTLRPYGSIVGTSVAFDDGTIRWCVVGSHGERSVDVERDVLGFQIEGEKKTRVRIRAIAEETAVLGCVGICGRKVRKDYVVEMDDEDFTRQFARRLRTCIESLDRPKRLFILLNPFGGRKNAKKIFQQVESLLVAADISYTLQETEYQFHAQELAHRLDITTYDGIVCVSGDGLLVEVLNGLLRREDWKIAIKMPLGIIPAGTGNGMIKSLLDSAGEDFSAWNAALTLIRGHKRALDVATIAQGQTLYFSMLGLSWGLVADIDIESEKYRWMGKARLDVYTLLRLMTLRKYNGLLYFVPAPGYENYGDPVGMSVSNKVENHDEATSLPCGYKGPVVSYGSTEWRFLDGPFIVVWLNNVPWVSCDAQPAPAAKFSDGYYDLLAIQECPKSALLPLLMKLGDGGHVESPHVRYLKVKACRLTPGHIVGNPGKGGIIDVDGEVIARGSGAYQADIHKDPMVYGPPVELRIDQALATIFAPPE